MAKKKATTPKRPPRQVWVIVNGNGTISASRATKREADADRFADERVVGPYVLAERVRER